MKEYEIKDNHLITRDKKSAKKHIEQGDYLGTTATILQLLCQEEIINNPREIKKHLKEISKELKFIQENFIIIKKP